MSNIPTDNIPGINDDSKRHPFKRRDDAIVPGPTLNSIMPESRDPTSYSYVSRKATDRLLSSSAKSTSSSQKVPLSPKTTHHQKRPATATASSQNNNLFSAASSGHNLFTAGSSSSPGNQTAQHARTDFENDNDSEELSNDESLRNQDYRNQDYKNQDDDWSDSDSCREFAALRSVRRSRIIDDKIAALLGEEVYAKSKQSAGGGNSAGGPNSAKNSANASGANTSGASVGTTNKNQSAWERVWTNRSSTQSGNNRNTVISFNRNSTAWTQWTTNHGTGWSNVAITAPLRTAPGYRIFNKHMLDKWRTAKKKELMRDDLNLGPNLGQKAHQWDEKEAQLRLKQYEDARKIKMFLPLEYYVCNDMSDRLELAGWDLMQEIITFDLLAESSQRSEKKGDRKGDRNGDRMGDRKGKTEKEDRKRENLRDKNDEARVIGKKSNAWSEDPHVSRMKHNQQERQRNTEEKDTDRKSNSNIHNTTPHLNLSFSPHFAPLIEPQHFFKDAIVLTILNIFGNVCVISAREFGQKTRTDYVHGRNWDPGYEDDENSELNANGESSGHSPSSYPTTFPGHYPWLQIYWVIGMRSTLIIWELARKLLVDCYCGNVQGDVFEYLKIIFWDWKNPSQSSHTRRKNWNNPLHDSICMHIMTFCVILIEMFTPVPMYAYAWGFLILQTIGTASDIWSLEGPVVAQLERTIATIISDSGTIAVINSVRNSGYSYRRDTVNTFVNSTGARDTVNTLATLSYTFHTGPDYSQCIDYSIVAQNTTNPLARKTNRQTEKTTENFTESEASLSEAKDSKSNKTTVTTLGMGRVFNPIGGQEGEQDPNNIGGKSQNPDHNCGGQKNSNIAQESPNNNIMGGCPAVAGNHNNHNDREHYMRIVKAGVPVVNASGIQNPAVIHVIVCALVVAGTFLLDWVSKTHSYDSEEKTSSETKSKKRDSHRREYISPEYVQQLAVSAFNLVLFLVEFWAIMVGDRLYRKYLRDLHCDFDEWGRLIQLGPKMLFKESDSSVNNNIVEVADNVQQQQEVTPSKVGGRTSPETRQKETRQNQKDFNLSQNEKDEHNSQNAPLKSQRKYLYNPSGVFSDDVAAVGLLRTLDIVITGFFFMPLFMLQSALIAARQLIVLYDVIEKRGRNVEYLEVVNSQASDGQGDSSIWSSAYTTTLVVSLQTILGGVLLRSEWGSFWLTTKFGFKPPGAFELAWYRIRLWGSYFVFCVVFAFIISRLIKFGFSKEKALDPILTDEVYPILAIMLFSCILEDWLILKIPRPSWGVVYDQWTREIKKKREAEKKVWEHRMREKIKAHRFLDQGQHDPKSRSSTDRLLPSQNDNRPDSQYDEIDSELEQGIDHFFFTIASRNNYNTRNGNNRNITGGNSNSGSSENHKNHNLAKYGHVYEEFMYSPELLFHDISPELMPQNYRYIQRSMSVAAMGLAHWTTHMLALFLLPSFTMERHITTY